MTTGCELPRDNPPAETIRSILKDAKTVAVVGHSDDPSRPSHRVGRYLAAQGYEVFAVNPVARPTPGLTFLPDLAAVPKPIDVVDIFRKPAHIAAIVDEAIRVGAKVIWMQDGLADNVAAEKARAAGLQVVQSRCMMRDHLALLDPAGRQD